MASEEDVETKMWNSSLIPLVGDTLFLINSSAAHTEVNEFSWRSSRRSVKEQKVELSLGPGW